MLRSNKNSNKSAAKAKRNSIFLDHNMLNLLDKKHQINNNQVTVPDIEVMKSQQSEKKSRQSSKPNSSTESRLKRSSIMLNANTVRDYQIAIRKFDTEVETPPERSDSDFSICSNKSSISSLFEEGVNIRDVLYEDLGSLDEISGEKDAAYLEATLHMTKQTSLFIISDVKDFDNKSLKTTLLHEITSIGEIDEQESRAKYSRTNLTFD
ncbi:uncharacterized protein NDAI_0A05580 [Naumovozyma dairenensis CBS 421]|uniref:Uncharacterized protein n=1 Tax=Naumovozyma dairenensis (strain ATCC 10597 / BCRC 20456 / CBS 421 / NBRC 0211 / NRRL Y-12639) TaxID=1071378 RepID=G0W4H5_NAUDC|nr:hypothetical protein NDAI_0A05580 [Naumovozyma dairenensis CBS 421]CCD22713.1 hypothetical protein NDAI_0A05580 [Naumovozyma dairenensis CBS 421]